MDGLYSLLYSIFDKPFYKEWSFWLAFFNLILICFTISETIKLRKETQRQVKLSRQPWLEFVANEKNGFVITNRSINTAFNIFIIFKDSQTYKILRDGLIISALPVNGSKDVNAEDLINMNEAELINKIGSAEHLIKYLNKINNCSCIVYEDVFGNKLFSIFYLSSDTLKYDQFVEIKYMEEIEGINSRV